MAFGGQPHKRIDGVAKVTGAARYATDEQAGKSGLRLHGHLDHRSGPGD